jgi:hypothetical protein
VESGVEHGMVMHAAADIFSKGDPDQTVEVSFVEIYNEQVIDLLNPRASAAKHDGAGKKG